jgi:hypothetical protein
MIAITVKLDPEFDVTPISHEVDRDERFQNNWDQVVDFFQMCVDQQLCVNLCKIESEPDPSGWYVVTTYFATDHERADQFIAVFTDMSADFSISKLFSEISQRLIITKKPVDFDLENSTALLVDSEQRILWGTYEGPY